MTLITGYLIPTLVLFLFLLGGCELIRRIFPDLRTVERLWLGALFGLLAFIWLPSLFAFFLGFTLAAHLLALAVCLLGIGAMAYFFRRERAGFSLAPQDRPLLVALLAFVVLCGVILYTHTLPERDGALYTGQSTYGDMAMHLGFITSTYAQKIFPPTYSIFPGTAVGYPFLCDTVSSSLMVLGAPLVYAYVLPMLVALALFFVGLYLFFERLLTKPQYAFLALALFVLCGGFGFAYFFDNRDINTLLPGMFTEFFTTPTNLIDQNIRWVNVICDMLIPQRATLFGWTFCFGALYLLLRLYDRGERKTAVLLGVLGGLLPLIHTHSFLALAVISAAVLLLYLKQKGPKPAVAVFWPYALGALVLALPQLLLFTFPQSAAESFLRFEFNWGNLYDNYIWFYIKNVGVVALLLIPAVLSAPKRVRNLSLGALLLFVLCEFVQFQPNAYDNNKLIYISYAFACGLVSVFMIDAYEKLKSLRGIQVLAATVLLACFTSAGLSIVRELNSSYELFSSDQVLAADWIVENTEEDALFLTAQNHNNAVASLTGRSIAVGADSFLYFHGIDTGERKEEVRRIFEEDGYLQQAEADYLGDHVYLYVSDFERSDFTISEAVLESNELVYQNGSVEIYRVTG